MPKKPKGKCSFCKEFIEPSVIEENTFRRDKCLCPKCNEYIYLCRYPGCDNYSRGGDMYDDELCSFCASDVSKSSGSIINTGLGVAAAILIKKKM